MKNKLVLALVALLLVAVPALATTVYDAIRPARQADDGDATWYMTGLTGNHSRTSSTAVDLQAIQGDDTYVKLKARSTVGNGAVTACFAVYTGGTDGVLDSIAGIQTVTFGIDSMTAGRYLAEPIYFDVGGESVYDVRCVAVSAGTVDIKVNTCGAASHAAE